MHENNQLKLTIDEKKNELSEDLDQYLWSRKRKLN